MFNKVILFGALSEPPDVYRSRSNLPACRLRVETRVRVPWQNREHREWTTVRVFGAQAERARRLKEGDRVSVEGTLYTSRAPSGGERRAVTEVIADSVQRLDTAGTSGEQAA